MRVGTKKILSVISIPCYLEPNNEPIFLVSLWSPMNVGTSHDALYITIIFELFFSYHAKEDRKTTFWGFNVSGSKEPCQTNRPLEGV
jgi:hypothetical protein